ncbi:MAG: hypothetical protein FJW37_12095 [Acidobacteria bacterium]|nr:hypothetical protein [Acidobacteriota bacterium]
MHRAPFCHFLAGLQAGMLGALMLLAWLALASLLDSRSIWTVPNLFATTFYGPGALGSDFGFRTFSGVALHLILYALAGAAFGLLIRDYGTHRRVLLLGVLSGLALYFLCFGLLWQALNPAVALYAPERSMLLGHLLYGARLGSFQSYRRSLCAPPRILAGIRGSH